jgi:hypothetical protein
VDRQPVAAREGVVLVVVADLEAEPLVVRDGARHVGDPEDDVVVLDLRRHRSRSFAGS